MANKGPSRVLLGERQSGGRYVAFDPDRAGGVIASGKDLKKVIASARAKGVVMPAIEYIPRENAVLIY